MPQVRRDGGQERHLRQGGGVPRGRPRPPAPPDQESDDMRGARVGQGDAVRGHRGGLWAGAHQHGGRAPDARAAGDPPGAAGQGVHGLWGAGARLPHHRHRQGTHAAPGRGGEGVAAGRVPAYGGAGPGAERGGGSPRPRCAARCPRRDPRGALHWAAARPRHWCHLPHCAQPPARGGGGQAGAAKRRHGRGHVQAHRDLPRKPWCHHHLLPDKVPPHQRRPRAKGDPGGGQGLHRGVPPPHHVGGPPPQGHAEARGGHGVCGDDDDALHRKGVRSPLQDKARQAARVPRPLDD
mmetsp:Transcript_27784/g.64693  ORF Transcript_27784/g.64693 Transcript_27784/m.64693 type:complete len:294 (-) Transcript_27784:98-979(-)